MYTTDIYRWYNYLSVYKSYIEGRRVLTSNMSISTISAIRDKLDEMPLLSQNQFMYVLQLFLYQVFNKLWFKILVQKKKRLT